MWFIYVSLCIGILIGASNKIPNRIIRYNDLLTLIGIYSLLFVMGVSIGINKDIINKLDKVGFQALIYAFLSVLFSIIVVYLLTSVLLRGKKK